MFVDSSIRTGCVDTVQMRNLRVNPNAVVDADENFNFTRLQQSHARKSAEKHRSVSKKTYFEMLIRLHERG